MDDWAIVGDAIFVRDKLDEYQARLGITHLVARGGLPRVCDDAQWASHARLLELVEALPGA